MILDLEVEVKALIQQNTEMKNRIAILENRMAKLEQIMRMNKIIVSGDKTSELSPSHDGDDVQQGNH